MATQRHPRNHPRPTSPQGPRGGEALSPRTSASVDSQSVDTTSGGEQRGRDNAKNVDGRKRHIVVDSMGLLMAVLVTAASIDDAKAAAELFARLDGQPMSHVKRMYADSKYHNFILYEWVETNAAWELNIVQRPKDAVGWVLLPIRWTVERTFAWLGRCRRLSKDREKSVRSSEAFVKLAMIHLMLNRLAKKRMPSSTIVRRHKPTCGTDTKPGTVCCHSNSRNAIPRMYRSGVGWRCPCSQSKIDWNSPDSGLIKTTALNTARTGSISAFQLDQQFGSFGFGSGLSHDFAAVHRLALAFGHACRTIR